MRSADFKRRLVCVRPGTLMVEPWQPYTSSEEFACTGLTVPDRTGLTVLFPTGHTDLTVPTGHMDLTAGIFCEPGTWLFVAPEWPISKAPGDANWLLAHRLSAIREEP